MRTIKELLQIMLENQERFDEGLCLWATNLWILSPELISRDECHKLKRYIKENRPSSFSSLDACIRNLNQRAYFWKPGKIKPRIKWIKKHIKKNS